MKILVRDNLGEMLVREAKAQAKAELIELLRDKSLYDRALFEKDALNLALEWLYVNGLTFDAWCTRCKRESTFSFDHILDNGQISGFQEMIKVKGAGNNAFEDANINHATITNTLRWLSFQCARDQNHTLIFVLDYGTQFIHGDPKNQKRFLVKIGQYPSVADLAQAEISGYRKVLSDDDFRQFNRALGLAAHGIGIGSFVYLRRIFERLVQETRDSADLSPEQAEEYKQARMAERIAILKESLPEFLVENKNLYSIMSKGIHELSDAECLAAFNLVKVGIQLILDEREATRQREKLKESVKKDISNITTKLNTE